MGTKFILRLINSQLQFYELLSLRPSSVRQIRMGHDDVWLSDSRRPFVEDEFIMLGFSESEESEEISQSNVNTMRW